MITVGFVYADENEDLITAINSGDIEAVKNALSNGADLNAKDNTGNTGLIIASNKGYTEIVRLLIEKGANLNIVDKYGFSALILASQEGHIEVVKLLIKSRADISIKVNKIFSALFFAIIYEHKEVIQLLKQAGVKCIDTLSYNNESIEEKNKNYKKAQQLFNLFLNVYQTNDTSINQTAVDLKIAKLINEIMCISSETEYGYYIRGAFSILKGDSQLALKHFTRAIEINSRFSEAYSGRGFLNFELKNFPSALKDAEKAIKINPRSSHTYLLRCYINKELKKYSLASSDLNIATKLNPNLLKNNEIKKLELNLKEVITFNKKNIKPNLRIKTLQGRFKVNAELTKILLNDSDNIQRFQSGILSLSLEILNFIDNTIVKAEGNLSAGLAYNYKIKNGRLLINIANMYITLIINDANTLIGEGIINGVVYKKYN